MEVRRTVIVTLDVDSDDAVLLHDTVDTFRQCANYVVDYAFIGDYVTTSKSALNDATYDDVRSLTDGFNSGLIQAARDKAVGALKSTVEKWKKGKEAGKPRFTAPHIVYDKRTATFHDDRVTLATTKGRVIASYVLPDRDSETPHSEYLFSDDYQIKGAELHYRNGSWNFISVQRRSWRWTRRNRQRSRTERFSGLTSA